MLSHEDCVDCRGPLQITRPLEESSRKRRTCAVVTAGDGRDGLECARRIPPPSLILLDLSMPRMNGWEFLRHKTADPTIAGIPTIVLSGSSGGIPAGAMSSLSKPVDVERLMALIDQYC